MKERLQSGEVKGNGGEGEGHPNIRRWRAGIPASVSCIALHGRAVARFFYLFLAVFVIKRTHPGVGSVILRVTATCMDIFNSLRSPLTALMDQSRRSPGTGNIRAGA